MTTSERSIDEQAVEAFAGHIFELCTGGVLTYLVDIGRRTGLFEAAAVGVVTSDELAQRAGMEARYVREWLGAMVTGGIFEYDPDRECFWLPREHAACLTGEGVGNLAPLASFTTMLGRHVPAVAAAFRDGGGVPYDAYLPELHDVMEALWGPMYDQLLVAEIVPVVPGLDARLSAGARVADIACGTGRAAIALAGAYPASTFIGYDLDATGLERARALANERALGNVAFEVRDAAAMVVDDPFVATKPVRPFTR